MRNSIEARCVPVVASIVGGRTADD